MKSLLAHTERILVVDDEEPIRTLLARILGLHGYDCVAVETAAEARAVLAEHEIALVLSDVRLPVESGFDLAGEIARSHPDTAVVMVTGVDDRDAAEQALAHGAYGYVLKPFRTNELLISVAGALRRRALELENRNHRERLEQTVLQRTAVLRETIASLERSEAEARRLREETVRRLAWAAEFRNGETGAHIVRMSLYCALLARPSRGSGTRPPKPGGARSPRAAAAPPPPSARAVRSSRAASPSAGAPSPRAARAGRGSRARARVGGARSRR